jgi:hypothetical protein
MDISPVAELFKPYGPKQSLERVFGSQAIVEGRASTTLAPVLRSALAQRSQRNAGLARFPQLPTPKTVTLDEVEGALTNLRRTLDVEHAGTITLTLPLGMEHYLVNAATFKAVAGRKGGTLLRQVGDRWEIVEDDEQIDLGNTKQLYKIGRLQVYS